MEEWEIAALIALGFVVGTYGTIVGIGGGFIVVPVLLFLYPDYDPERLTAVSLAVVCANSLSGSLAYARQGRIDYGTGLLFAVSSAPGIVLGLFLVDLMPERAFALLLAVLLLALALVAVRGPPRGIRRPLAGRGVIVRSLVAPEGTYRFGYRAWQGVALSMSVGLASSLFGIGGGWIHVPAMISLLHFPVQFAVATSQFILVFMSGGATLVNLADGTLAGDGLAKAGAMAAGTIPGAQLGALMARRLKPRVVLGLLASALFVLSLRLLVRGLTEV